MATLSHIVRYPVKGLSGIESPAERVQPGSGLRGDRILAIENGVVTPERPGGWNPRETYYHLAKHEQIADFGVALHSGSESELELRHRDCGVRLRIESPGFERDLPDAEAFLTAALGEPGAAPRLVRADRGLWDWPDAHLSIINLDTLAALGEAAGEPVDRRRFRSNLYVSGLGPWGEFALLGRRVRIGSAVLEIFQPTDRCRATTIGPDSAVSDLNIPGLLASSFGHMFCGVYARVVSEGVISSDDRIEILNDASAPLVDASADWPRTATLTAVERESAAVKSLWFEDHLGLMAGASAGQHVRVHLPGTAAPSWRCYTVSAIEPGRFRISVKLDGRVSGELHDNLHIGDQITITGPSGGVTLETETGADLLLVSAGVGITPTAAMLRALREERTARRVRVVHVDRDDVNLALWDEVREAVAALPEARAALFLTRTPDPAALKALDAKAGRPGADALQRALDGIDTANLEVFMCGPTPFTDEMRAALTGLGTDTARIRNEVFFSPTAAQLGPAREPSTTGPHPVHFGSDRATWTADRGTLLDLAEASGRGWGSGCRSGACGTCAQRLEFGEVEYLSEPIAPIPEGHVLSCCSVPVGPVGFAD